MKDPVAPFRTVQCPKCPRKMGQLVLYCAACGTKLLSNPVLENPTEFAARRKELFTGELCGRLHHVEMAKYNLPINVQSGISPKVFCADCGLEVTQLHPDFMDEQPS